jgi:hypothetical protein
LKAIRLPSGATFYAQEYNALRSDAVASSWLHVHQQLGAIALSTNPSNTNTLTLDINGSNVVLTFVSSIGSTAGNVLIGASAAVTVANVVALLQNPTVTTSTGVALSSANATLVQYLGWGLPSGGTTITPFSLNTSTYAPLTSFSASTTVTSGTWTAQTMQLYVEPGTYFIGGTRYFFLGGSTPTVTAPVSHPRIDVLTINSSGSLAWTTGTENASPSAPSYPAGKLPLCELYNVVSETALYDVDNQQSGQGYISNDVRQLLSNPYGQFILDPGSEAQGDVLYWNGSAWVLLAPGTNGYFLQTQGSGANPQWAQPVANTASGAATFSGSSGTQTIAHGLGRTPQLVRIFANSTALSAGTIAVTSAGDSNNVCVYMGNSAAAVQAGSDGSHAVNIICQTGGSAASYVATITLDATNIYLAWTKTGSPNQVNFIWEAQ